MELTINHYQPLKKIEYSFERQLNKGFKSFISLLMGSKKMEKTVTVAEPAETRNYFLDKYQQLLINGKTGNVQVIKVEKNHAAEIDKNAVVYLTFQLISAQGVRLFNAVAMATRENTPQPNTIIPIFYNADDLSVVVLL